MYAVTLSEWVGMSTAVIGTIVAVVTLALQLRQRAAEGRASEARERVREVDRWEEDRISRAGTRVEAEEARAEAARRRTDATLEYEAIAGRPAARRRRSYKAIAAAILGGLSLLGALALGAASERGEPVAATDAVGVLFYAGIGLLLGLSAQRDVKQDPGRRGKGMAWTGIATAVIGGLVAAGSLSAAPSDGPTQRDGAAAKGSPTGGGGAPQLVVQADCTGYRVMNSGTSAAGPFTVAASDQVSSGSFQHAGLGPGGTAGNPWNGAPVGVLTVQADPQQVVAESDESDNAVQFQC